MNRDAFRRPGEVVEQEPGGRPLTRVRHSRYFVVLENDRWMILFDGALYGPYRAKAQAINNAIDTAQLAKGKSQVFVAKDQN